MLIRDFDLHNFYALSPNNVAHIKAAIRGMALSGTFDMG